MSFFATQDEGSPADVSGWIDGVEQAMRASSDARGGEASGEQHARQHSDSVSTAASSGAPPPRSLSKTKRDARNAEINAQTPLPQVGDIFPTRRDAQLAFSRAWHHLGYRSVVLQSHKPQVKAVAIVGCPKATPLSRPDLCRVKARLEPVEKEEREGRWEVVESFVEHGHPPEKLGAWRDMPLGNRGPRRARNDDAGASDEDSDASSQRRALPATNERPPIGKKQKVLRERSIPKPASTLRTPSTSHRTPSSSAPSAPPRLLRITASSSPSTPSRPLSIKDLTNLLTSLSPSLATFAPLFHAQGLRSIDSFLALVHASEEGLVGVLEEEGVRGVQRKILVKKFAELQEEWEEGVRN